MTNLHVDDQRAVVEQARRRLTRHDLRDDGRSSRSEEAAAWANDLGDAPGARSIGGSRRRRVCRRAGSLRRPWLARMGSPPSSDGKLRSARAADNGSRASDDSGASDDG